MLAAQLISRGKRPYADFLFAQPPLNAYWNALLVALFGPTWRAAHVAAAIETTGAVALTATYIVRRFPVPEWRTRLGVITALLMGLNIVVFEYGTLSQAYGLCLLLIVAAFRLAVAAANRDDGLWLAALGAVASGAAAAASLLAAPVGLVLIIWLGVRARTGRRIATLAAFTAGAAIGLGPLLLDLLRWPRQVLFDVVGFHVYFRQAEWDGWLGHDLGVVTAWLNSSQTFVLLVLALAGFLMIRRSGWDRGVRAEFYLCAWLAAALALYVTTAHPTFRQYFVLAVPFASILGAAGLYAVAREAPGVPCAIVIVITIGGLARSLYDDRDSVIWKDVEKVTQAVRAVTPRGALLCADEAVYFLSGHEPPAGLEWTGGHKIRMPLQEALSRHVLPEPDLDRKVKQREFATLETCYESEVDRLELRKIYAKEKNIGDCYVFWEFRH